QPNFREGYHDAPSERRLQVRPSGSCRPGGRGRRGPPLRPEGDRPGANRVIPGSAWRLPALHLLRLLPHPAPAASPPLPRLLPQPDAGALLPLLWLLPYALLHVLRLLPLPQLHLLRLLPHPLLHLLRLLPHPLCHLLWLLPPRGQQARRVCPGSFLRAV